MSNDPKALLAAKFLDSFLREIVLDTAIHTHAKIKRARSICHLCGVRCQAHAPAAEQSLISNLDASNTPSRSATPVPGATSTSTTAAHKPDYYSNNPLFECLVCSRQVSSNRYATHLAKCMGMGSKGGRKGAARNAKATTSSLAGSSRQSGTGTPRYASDADDDSFAKRKNGAAAGTKNGVKRGSSPLAASSLANARMNKRIKTSSPTPPPSDSLGMGMNRSYSSQPFAPSGLSTSTVLSGSPLNPNNNGSTPLSGKAGTSGKNGSKKAASPSKKRKRLIDDDDDDDDDDADSYHDASDGDSNEEEGEISDDNVDDDDDDVALAAASAAPRPPSSGTKIKIPLRATPSSSTSTPKPKTFVVADDSDSDTLLSTNRKSHPIEDEDQEDDDDDDDDDEDEDDDDDDDDQDEEDDEDDDMQVTSVTHARSTATKAKPPAASNGGLQRERGSDGEFIDVESASDQSDADSF